MHPIYYQMRQRGSALRKATFVRAAFLHFVGSMDQSDAIEPGLAAMVDNPVKGPSEPLSYDNRSCEASGGAPVHIGLSAATYTVSNQHMEPTAKESRTLRPPLTELHPDPILSDWRRKAGVPIAVARNGLRCCPTREFS